MQSRMKDTFNLHLGRPAWLKDRLRFFRKNNSSIDFATMPFAQRFWSTAGTVERLLAISSHQGADQIEHGGSKAPTSTTSHSTNLFGPAEGAPLLTMLLDGSDSSQFHRLCQVESFQRMTSEEPFSITSCSIQVELNLHCQRRQSETFLVEVFQSQTSINSQEWTLQCA